MKRCCLFDSKHTWDHEASISDLLPNAETLGFFSPCFSPPDGHRQMHLLQSLYKTLGCVCSGGWGKQCKVQKRNDEKEMEKTVTILIADPSQTLSTKLKDQQKWWELFFFSCLLSIPSNPPTFFIPFLLPPFLQSDKVCIFLFQTKQNKTVQNSELSLNKNPAILEMVRERHLSILREPSPVLP